MRGTILIAAACVAFGPGAPALAQRVRGLPEGWSMADDARYAPEDTRWRYKAPRARRGTYAHGASGEPRTAQSADAQRCSDAGPYPDASMPGEEYWYFEAAGEALLLLKTNFVNYDANCAATIGATYTVERALIGPEGFTRFVEAGDGWRGETRQFAEHYHHKIDDIAIGNPGPAMQRFAIRKRRLGDSDRCVRIGKVETHCISHSSPPDGGGSQCWIAGPGPGRGIVTWDSVVLIGSEFTYQAVSELEDGVALDGRLFEWDRPIRHKEEGHEGKQERVDGLAPPPGHT